MPYRKDGSLLELSKGRAKPGLVCYGWLTPLVPYSKAKDPGDYLAFRNLADSVRCQMTHGHHICGFCGWDDCDYGNGEIWITIESTTYVLPRMIWHYIKEHEYVIPFALREGVADGNFKVLDDQEVAAVCDDSDNECVDVAYLIYHAFWEERRYRTFAEFHDANHHVWWFNESVLQDGYFVAKMRLPPDYVAIRFEADPENFPDKIEVVMVNPSFAGNKAMKPDISLGRMKRPT